MSFFEKINLFGHAFNVLNNEVYRYSIISMARNN